MTTTEFVEFFILAYLLAVLIARVIRVTTQYLWFRLAYSGRFGADPLGRKFLGRFGEGTILPWWAAILRRVMEPDPR